MTCLLLTVLLAVAPAQTASTSAATEVPASVESATRATTSEAPASVDSATGATPSAGLPATGELRRFHEINNDLRDQIRGYARAETRSEQAGWARQMCTLYLEIKRDARLTTSDTLKTYKAKLWSVLQRIQLDVSQQLAREQRQQGKADDRQSQEQPFSTGDQLASPGEQRAWETSHSLAGALSLLGGLLGGPGDLLAHGGSFGEGSFGEGAFGGGAVGGDYGPALVELIQRTIAPEFWDVNGGPGTIVYYAPLRVLVVRATSEVHHNVGAAVGAVRRAGQ